MIGSTHFLHLCSFKIMNFILISSSGCVLEAGKEVVFNPDDDDLEHQLDLRMVRVFLAVYSSLYT